MAARSIGRGTPPRRVRPHRRGNHGGDYSTSLAFSYVSDRDVDDSPRGGAARGRATSSPVASVFGLLPGRACAILGALRQGPRPEHTPVRSCIVKYLHIDNL